MNVNGPDRDETEEAVEDAFETIVRQGGMDLFSADTRAEVERILMPGQALEPGARVRLVDAARRGALARSAGRRPVERLLFESRRASNRSIDDVANSVGAAVSELTDVERGQSRITVLPARLVASWIEALGVDRSTAVLALTTSLSGMSDSPAYAASPTPQLDPEDARFVAEVRIALGLDNTKAT